MKMSKSMLNSKSRLTSRCCTRFLDRIPSYRCIPYQCASTCSSTSMWTSRRNRLPRAQCPTRRAEKTATLQPAWCRRRSSLVKGLPSSAPAQHAGGIAAVIDGRNHRGRRVRILRGAAEARSRAAGLGEGPRRIVRLLDRGFAATQRDDGGVAGLRQLNAFERHRADRGCASQQIDDGLTAQRPDIQLGAADADGRQRRRDLVGGLFRIAGHEPEGARRQPYCDVAIMVLVVEHGAVELQRGIRTERQIGAVGHHQPRRAVEAGAHDFVAQQSIADIDLTGGRRGDAENFVFYHGRFADTRGSLSRRWIDTRHKADSQHSKNVVTRNHFPPYNLYRSSYRIVRASDVVKLAQSPTLYRPVD